MGKVVQFAPRATPRQASLKDEKAAVLAEFQETKRQIGELKERAKRLFERYVELCRPGRKVMRSAGALWAAKLALLLALVLQASG